MVEELILSSWKPSSIYVTESFDFLSALPDGQVSIIKEKELERISGLRTPNKVLAVVEVPKAKSLDWKDDLIVLLDGIGDPGNLGTIIRTCKWFGVNTIVCSEDCVDVFDRKVVQSTMGALFHMNIRYSSLAEFILEGKSNGFSCIGAAMAGVSVYEQPRSGKTMLIIGSESHGISNKVLELCDNTVTIPNNEGVQRVESLNAAIATSVLLSELTRPLK